MATSTEQTFLALSQEIESALASNAYELERVKHSGVSLSTRERTIVLLMGRGLSNKRIARQLSIAPETVKSHAKSIFWKLTVQTRAQAVYRASTLGLI
jgi:ATP/maltotriose-dependent transcriptional regulator MalT